MKPRNFLKRYFTTGETRRRAWGRHFERRAAAHGLAAYKAHLNWLMPGPFAEASNRWCGAPGIPTDRCFLLFSAAQAAARVPGATADCGVRYGKSSYFLLEGFADPARPHHIFDSFEGLSEPTAADSAASTLGRDKWHRGDLAVSEDQVRHNLAAFANAVFHPGWIPQSFQGLTEARYALVHVDVDLYEPTLACCEYFYPRMNPGGYLICDDYGFATCPGATRAVDEFFADKPEAPLALPSGQCLVVKV